MRAQEFRLAARTFDRCHLVPQRHGRAGVVAGAGHELEAYLIGFGFLFGQPALRLSGVYLALATFALATAMPQLLKLGVFEHWTGGVQGLVVTKPDAPFGLPMSQDMWLYYFTLAVTIAIYLFSVNLLRSRSGRAFMAIRDNEIAASAMGIDVALYKTLAFGVSAGITGVAGGLGAIAVQFVAPDGYTITLAISLFLGMVVGGVGWLPGSIVGSAFIIFVPNIAEGISKGLSGAVFGVLLFLVLELIERALMPWHTSQRHDLAATA